MKKLYLVRHAKSSWEHEGVLDMDRPLKGRGIQDAYGTSRWMLDQGEQAEFWYSSPATRALHTALIFAREMGFPFGQIRIVQDLYECQLSDLAKLVKSIPNEATSAMVFGHNPAITQYVNRCIDHSIDNVPTTGVACLNFKAETWAQAGDEAELLFFDYPKLRR